MVTMNIETGKCIRNSLFVSHGLRDLWTTQISHTFDNSAECCHVVFLIAEQSTQILTKNKV